MEQVILFVAGERQRQMRAERGHAAAGGDPQFAEEAAPEEQDVSDAELLSIAARSRRR